MPSRRSLLTTLAVGLAGCAASRGPSTTTRRTRSAEPTATDTRTGTPTGTTTRDSGTPDGTPEGAGDAPSGPAVRWTADLGGPVTDRPVVSDGVLYVAGGRNDRGDAPDERAPIQPESSQNLYAFGLEGGEQWRYEAAAGVNRPVPTDHGVYAVVGWSGGLTGIANRVVQVRGGAHQWESDSFDSFLTILGTGDGAVYAGTSDDALGTSGEQLFALAHDGTERWRVDSGDALGGTVANGTLYLPLADRELRAIDTDDGSRRWSFPAGTAGGETRVFGDTLYLDSPEQNDAGDYPLVAVDATDGTERWRYSAPGGDDGPFVVTGAIEADGTVYGTEYGGLLFAVDAADGTELWRYETDGDTTSPPVVVGDTVYLEAGHDTLHAVDAASGQGRWTRPAGSRLHTVLASDETIVAAGNGEGGARYVAFAPDGTRQWDFTHDGETSRGVLAGGRVYLGTESGYLTCLGP